MIRKKHVVPFFSVKHSSHIQPAAADTNPNGRRRTCNTNVSQTYKKAFKTKSLSFVFPFSFFQSAKKLII